MPECRPPPCLPSEDSLYHILLGSELKGDEVGGCNYLVSRKDLIPPGGQMLTNEGGGLLTRFMGQVQLALFFFSSSVFLESVRNDCQLHHHCPSSCVTGMSSRGGLMGVSGGQGEEKLVSDRKVWLPAEWGRSEGKERRRRGRNQEEIARLISFQTQAAFQRSI